MKKSMKIALLSAAAASVSIAAYAGTKFSGIVVVVDASKTVRGSMGGARNSVDNEQIISVGFTGSSTSATRIVTFLYRNSAGVQRSCVSANPAIVATADTIESDSWVSMTYDASGNCTGVIVNQNSAYEPKVK